jgi:hypothetical protein
MFKWLPSDASASGPFGGLKWKLGGAFAGYFLIVLISMNYVSDLKKAALDQQAENLKGELAHQAATLAAETAKLGEPWTISGFIQKADGTLARDAQFATNPPDLITRPDKSFSLSVLLPRREPGDALLPYLLVNYEHCNPVSIPLPWDNNTKLEFAIGETKYTATRDSASHTIIIKPTIVLEPAPESADK